MPFTNLITSEHADKLKFVEMVGLTCQPAADLTAIYALLSALYDVDSAVGQQLDVCGQWVGVSRNLAVAIEGVYFSFDAATIGFDQGVWKGPYDLDTGLVSLPDDHYRALIKVRILNNHWDGSLASAYALTAAIFGPLGFTLYIEDPSDLTMRMGLFGSGPPPALVQALLGSGKFNVKPAGIHISTYFSQSAAGPMFGFDLTTLSIAGFDSSTWATAVNN